jgi:hypothetical protein
MATKVRKQFVLDPDLLRRARDYFGAKTDTETVERALQAAAINAELDQAHARFAESGVEIVDVYGRLTD